MLYNEIQEHIFQIFNRYMKDESITKDQILVREINFETFVNETNKTFFSNSKREMKLSDANKGILRNVYVNIEDFYGTTSFAILLEKDMLEVVFNKSFSIKEKDIEIKEILEQFETYIKSYRLHRILQ